MMTPIQLQSLLGDSLFGGNTELAGLLMYGALLAAIFALAGRKNLIVSLLLAIVATLAFSMLGIISSNLTMLLIVIAVLGLAISVKDLATRS